MLPKIFFFVVQNLDTSTKTKTEMYKALEMEQICHQTKESSDFVFRISNLMVMFHSYAKRKKKKDKPKGAFFWEM